MDLEQSALQASRKACAAMEIVPEKATGSASGAGEVATDGGRFQVLGRGAGRPRVCGEGKLRSISWGSDRAVGFRRFIHSCARTSVGPGHVPI